MDDNEVILIDESDDDDVDDDHDDKGSDSNSKSQSAATSSTSGDAKSSVGGGGSGDVSGTADESDVMAGLRITEPTSLNTDNLVIVESGDESTADEATLAPLPAAAAAAAKSAQHKRKEKRMSTVLLKDNIMLRKIVLLYVKTIVLH